MLKQAFQYNIVLLEKYFVHSFDHCNVRICTGSNATTSSLSLSGSGSYSRQVTHEEGSALAKKFGCPYIETSAAHRKHVDDVFHTLVREIKRHQVTKLCTIYLNEKMYKTQKIKW